LLNASVGVQRALDRLRPVTSHRSTKAISVQRHSLAAAKAIRGLVLRPRADDRLAHGRYRVSEAVGAVSTTAAAAVPSFLAGSRHVALRNGRLAARSAYADGPVLTMARSAERRSLVGRFGSDRIVPAVAVAIVAIAVAISSAPSAAANGPAGPVGGPTGDGPGARLAAGAAVTQSDQEGVVDPGISDSVGPTDGREGGDQAPDGGAIEAVAGSGAVVDDGTIVKPVAVDTTVADGKGLMRSYRVRSGDTLTGIARKFGVSMMTVWWANHLTSKTELHVGQTLTIPPVSGVVVTVGPSDSLDTLAARYHVEPADIVQANELEDPNLVIGQTLTIPGALGSGISTPKPAAPAPHRSSGSSNSGGGSSKPPVKYTGGRFAWPVAGGYISQYYHYGHYAIDIAADAGTTVKAAAAGVVTFAGWKSNGGGYQVWISHGSGLYTTYNHMSSISVGRGQHVGRGQQVGRVGSSGNATGPHLHFEVWKGPIWDGGVRVNPLAYL
jgi:murein DD-endopeptidase MepM/ murein hydrolase activator NlpD